MISVNIRSVLFHLYYSGVPTITRFKLFQNDTVLLFNPFLARFSIVNRPLSKLRLVVSYPGSLLTFIRQNKTKQTKKPTASHVTQKTAESLRFPCRKSYSFPSDCSEAPMLAETHKRMSSDARFLKIRSPIQAVERVVTLETITRSSKCRNRHLSFESRKQYCRSTRLTNQN